jgi:hypothetical protein
MAERAPKPTNPETRDFDAAHDKKVDGHAHKRLSIAHEVINDVKKINQYAGNQREGLKLSKGNSAYRGSLLRDDTDSDNWKWNNEAAKLLADRYPEAFHAAKAEILGAVPAAGVSNPGAGGTCWDQATLAYYFLRIKAVGEPIAVVSSPIDHAFTHIGDHTKEDHSEVAVCDAWPTRATACLWEEHFCHVPLGDSQDVRKGQHMIADGGGKADDGKTDAKEAIKAGLALSDQAKKFIQTTLTDKEVDRHLKSGMDRNREWPEQVRPDQPVYHHWSNETTTAPGEEIRSLDVESPGGRYMTEEQINGARGGHE